MIDFYDLHTRTGVRRFAYEVEAMAAATQAQEHITPGQPCTIAVKRLTFNEESGRRLSSQVIWLRTFDGQHWTEHATVKPKLVRRVKEPLPDWVQQPGLKTAMSW